MIRHVVMFRFRNGLTDERRAAFDAAVHALAIDIKAISRLSAGPALRLQEGPIDYVLALDFDGPEQFTAYKQHPAHQAFIERQARPCVAETIRAQVDVD